MIRIIATAVLVGCVASVCAGQEFSDPVVSDVDGTPGVGPSARQGLPIEGAVTPDESLPDPMASPEPASILPANLAPPRITGIYEKRRQPVPLQPGTEVTIRQPTFQVKALLPIVPPAGTRLVVYFDGLEIGSGNTDGKSLEQIVPTQKKFPPGRYMLTVGLEASDPQLAIVPSEPVRVHYQPTYVRRMHQHADNEAKPSSARRRSTEFVSLFEVRRPSAENDPFIATPLLQKLKAAESVSDFSIAGGESDPNAADESSSKPKLDYRFDAPANFPIPAYGLAGEPLEKEGAVIYEGMQFVVYDGGRYGVRFVVGTPPVPVTFRLQLHLFNKRDHHVHTLTLPPITIPRQENRRHTAQAVYVVHHEGYLPVLECDYKDICVVRRQGTARFGFGVDVP